MHCSSMTPQLMSTGTIVILEGDMKRSRRCLGRASAGGGCSCISTFPRDAGDKCFSRLSSCSQTLAVEWRRMTLLPLKKLQCGRFEASGAGKEEVETIMKRERLVPSWPSSVLQLLPVPDSELVSTPSQRLSHHDSQQLNTVALHPVEGVKMTHDSHVTTGIFSQKGQRTARPVIFER